MIKPGSRGGKPQPGKSLIDDPALLQYFSELNVSRLELTTAHAAETPNRKIPFFFPFFPPM